MMRPITSRWRGLWLTAGIVAASFALGPTAAFAAATGPWALSFIDPQTVGLNGAPSAVGQMESDVWSGLVNPARLSELDTRGIGGSLALIPQPAGQPTYRAGFSYVEPDYGSGAGQLAYVHDQELYGIDVTTPLYQTDNTFVYAVGKRITPALSLGAAGRFLVVTRDGSGGAASQTRSAYRLDAGAAADLGRVHLDAVVQNATGSSLRFSNGQVDAPDPSIRVGGAVQLGSHVSVGVEGASQDARIWYASGVQVQWLGWSVRGGLSWPPGQGRSWAVGASWLQPSPNGRLRLDVSYQAAQGAAGVGQMAVSWLF